MNRPNLMRIKQRDVSYWQILLQKSQKAEGLIFRQITKQATIADQ
jgi:hypothetical protein